MTRTTINRCAIWTGTETLLDGHLIVEDGWITGVGSGLATSLPGDTHVDGAGMLATPGLVNCHHHLYQHATRGLAQQANLFEWLVDLYPVWSLIDAEIEEAAARAGLATLLLSGCSLATDHHYIFPRDGGDILDAEVRAARDLGIRFHPCRGSMDLGRSRGGLPPDHVVEDRDAVLDATEMAINRYHDPDPTRCCGSPSPPARPSPSRAT